MIRELFREAAAAARSQPVASVLTLLIIIGMVLTVMLTTGRTVGAEQRVLGSIDAAGTRSITVRAETDAGVTASVMERIAVIDGIEWAGAFSIAMDATNTAIPDGTRVPVRFMYGPAVNTLGIPAHSPDPGSLAYASQTALDQLGIVDAAGSITLVRGDSYGVVGILTTPEYLTSLEPLVVIPQPQASGQEPVNLLIVIASRPDLVAPVSDAILSVLAAEDPQKVTVQTSEGLAELRALIEGQLGTFSRGLVLAILALTGTLVAVLLYGLVMLRRKDYGRRRALGATRALIIGLLLVQTALLALVGIAIGTASATITLLITKDPLPGIAFTTALAILTLTVAVLAAIIPALVASRREPIRELRVP